ncbi:carbohydrate-binding domain-containing protein [Bacteroidales bacterium OttesenSCG-928-L19]|nr:carbohydrate-binding domain-containing protein [Bacteroidales bacterium OttesenSCG-928-L19]
MKKYILLIMTLSLALSGLFAQQHILVHKNGTLIYETPVSEVDSIKFTSQNSVFNYAGSRVTIPTSDIDSLTFREGDAPSGEIVYVIYNGDDVTIINPFEEAGVTVTHQQGHVTAISESPVYNIHYHLSGTTANGSFAITSINDILMTLSGVSIIHPEGSAIKVNSGILTTVQLENTSTLSDGVASSQNGTFQSSGQITFRGNGTLTAYGYKKYAILSSLAVNMRSGTINIPQSAGDAIHSESFVMNGGNLTIQATGDAIDAGSGTIVIHDGNINVTSTATDVKGIKCDGNMTIHDGTLTLNISGAQSKALSSKANITINGGDINIVTSGNVVLETDGSGYDPSYCTAIKSTGATTVNGGNLTIESKSTASGGKGISADGDVVITGGIIHITTAGNGATYTNGSGAADSYTSCCIKSDGNITLQGGVITCSSTGTGGKGISADGTLVIGTLGSADENLQINVTTSGERFYVSGYGDNADYANPKAIKSEGDLTVNSGIITIYCSQTDEGGEGLESKSTLRICGGKIDIDVFDDCINASNHIEISGGNNHFVSRGNDATDSNGTLTISGGFTISGGTRAPEGGFDCDQSNFSMNGGIVIGTGGDTSNPTISTSSQYSIKYNGTAGNAVCIKNSSGTIILLYQMPTYTGTGGGGPGGGGPGGGGNSMILLFSDPQLAPGSYTLQYGGTITGGTTVNGYNTGGSYSGGSSRNFTISGKLTTIN